MQLVRRNLEPAPRLLRRPPRLGRLHFSGVREAACLQCAAEVWRVEWNITGTVLASSGDDGYVRLWRTDVGPEGWTQINQFRSQEPGRD